MTEMRDADSNAKLRLKRLRCRRTGEMLTPQQHLDCPYCLGDAESLGKPRYDTFCTFRPGEDPVCFGFPRDNVRMLKG